MRQSWGVVGEGSRPPDSGLGGWGLKGGRSGGRERVWENNIAYFGQKVC